MRETIKHVIRRTPVLGGVARKIGRRLRPAAGSPSSFPGTEEYWERRYAAGGTSGVGSYGFFAEFKANVINDFVSEHDVRSVIELGCGDGHQLGLGRYPRYLGFDVSASAIEQCRARHGADETKAFRLMSEYRGDRADLALSLDVIYHLVEDQVFESYMRTLFGAAERFVIIYSSDTDAWDGDAALHVRHRSFTEWVETHEPDWTLIRHVPNRYEYRGDHRTGSFAEFFIYRRAGAAIGYRDLTADDLAAIGDIDRTETVRTGYRLERGRLLAEPVEWDVPRFTAEGEGDHSVARQIAFCRQHMAAGAHAIGAFDGETLVGVGVLTPEIRPATAQLAYLQVSASHRRRGIAATLVDRLLEKARASGATRVYVSATPSESAVGFYRRLGFAPVAEPFPELFALEPEDIHMRLELDTGAAEHREP